jgi:hypothetical protein
MQMGITQMIWLQSLTAFFALVAAGMWLYASRLPTPKELTVITLRDTGFGGELPKLFSAVALQSKWNARAAGCAAASAALQAVTIILGAIK